MTNLTPFRRRGAAFPTAPRGEVLATYETYPEAQQAVDHLAKADVDVAGVSIVGNDLKSVERVTGRLTYARAALAGALSGLWFGLFVGLLLSLISSPAAAFANIGAAALIGAGFGLLYGLMSYSFTRRNRDFTSQTQVLASNYQVLVPSEALYRAQAALEQSPVVRNQTPGL